MYKQSMDVNIEIILLYELSCCIWVLYNAVSTVDCSLHKLCTVICVKSAFLLALNHLRQAISPVKVILCFLKKDKLKVFLSYEENTENSEIDKNGKSLEKRKWSPDERQGRAKSLEDILF